MEPGATRTSRARRLLWLAAVAVVAAGAGGLSLRVGGGVTGDAGPGQVRLAARADAAARTELLVPPFGSVSAETHRAPVTLSVRVEQVDLGRVEALVGGSLAEARLRQEIERDLHPLVRSLFLRCLVVGAVAGALVGAIAPRRRWTSLLAGLVGGAAGAGALLGLAWSSFDPAAFEEPRFSGPLREAPNVIATARQYVDDYDAVRGRVDVLSAQVRDLYATSLTDDLRRGPGDQRILHVSDLHLNPVGVEVVRELAEQFEVDAILDTGDTTSFGHPLEGQFGQLLEDLELPYYLVPGNHDSSANRTALDALENVTVVDGQLVDIAGVQVLGVAHPVFTADNETPDDDVDAAVRRQSRRTARLVRELDPDVLAVHAPAQAEASLGGVPLVVGGHVHRRTWTLDDGTLVLTVGSTGATGLGALTVDTDLAYEAAVLYFDGPRLIAVDNIALRGVDGDFTIERRLVDRSAAVPG